MWTKLKRTTTTQTYNSGATVEVHISPHRSAWDYVRRWPWMVWLAGINGGVMLAMVEKWRDTGSARDFWIVLPSTVVLTFIVTRIKVTR